MNTPAHLIFGAALFARAGRPAITAAAFAGAVIPDLSLYLMAGFHLFVLETPPQVVFDRLYFSQEWQSIFRIDNSFILWGIVLVLGVMAQSKIVVALCGAALLHIMLDFSFHHDDGRAHFWPITNWIFESPISYWDRAHYAHIVSPLEVGAAVICAAVLWRRFEARGMRALIMVLIALQLSASGMFRLIL